MSFISYFSLTLSDLFVLKHFHFVIDNIDVQKQPNIQCIYIMVWPTSYYDVNGIRRRKKNYFSFLFSILLGLLDGKISQRIVYWNKGGMGLGCGRFARH